MPPKAKPAESEYHPISVPVFERMSGMLQFDVYIQRAPGAYTRIFPKGDSIDKARLIAYNTLKKVDAFFVRSDDYREYSLYVQQVAETLLNKPEAASAEDVAAIVKDMIDCTMIEIMVNLKVDQKSVSDAAQTVKGCVEMLERDPKSLVRLFSLMSRQPYEVKHAIATSIFSLLLLKNEKMTSEKSLMTVGLGGLLHDLGMVHLQFDPESKENLSPEEWRELKGHPEMGKRMLDRVKGVTQEVRSIVLQHHEQPNGRGYPNGLHDRDIYLLAKFVAIADSFSALISKRPYREDPPTPLQALNLMLEDRGKFDPKLLESFGKLFVTLKDQ